MITHTEVEKLSALHAAEPAMLSLYLAVPTPLPDVSVLAARAGELIASAEAAVGRTMPDQLREGVQEKLAMCARDWPGPAAAVFSCSGPGLLEVLPVSYLVPERAVLGIRPHVRPLLLVLQRCPAYRVAMVDEWRTWLFSVDGGEVERVWVPMARRDDGPGMQLAWLVREAEREPVVVGGRDDRVRKLLGAATPAVRRAVAGSFSADPRELTAAQVRDLASPVIARWADLRARAAAAEIVAMPPGGLSAVGLPACLAAVSAGAVQALVVPADELVPGYECGRCGRLSLDMDDCCPDWGTAALPVPDVIEEMVSRILEDGGEVAVVCDGSYPVAARLYFRVAQAPTVPRAAGGPVDRGRPGHIYRLSRSALPPLLTTGTWRGSPSLGDEPQRLVVPALEDVAPEDEARGARLHRLARLVEHGLVAGLLAAGDQQQRPVGDAVEAAFHGETDDVPGITGSGRLDRHGRVLCLVLR